MGPRRNSPGPHRLPAPSMVPFEAVFGATETRIGSVLDWNMLLAIVVCAVIGWGVTSLIRNAGYASAAMIEEVEQVDRTGRP